MSFIQEKRFWRAVAIVIIQFILTMVMVSLFGFLGLVLMILIIAGIATYKRVRSGDWSLSPRRNCLKILDGARGHVYHKYGGVMTRQQEIEVDQTIEKYKKIVEKVVFI